MKRRGLSADIVLLLIAVLGFAGLSFEMSTHAPENRDDGGQARRTTNSNRPGGWRAFYMLLQESGLKVERWTHRPSTWPADARVVIIGPEYSDPDGGSSNWTSGETETALKWVGAGGTLIVMSDRSNDLIETLHLELQNPGKPETVYPAQPAVMMSGVAAVSSPEGVRFSESNGGVVALLQGRESEQPLPTAIVLTSGAGRIVAISSAAMADNAHLGEEDNARFLTQMVATLSANNLGQQGRVLFDEFHQGYDEDESLWGIIGPNGHMIVYELIVLALIAAYSAGRRFGLPQPVPTPQRVSSEYVQSLADLYRRGHAGDAALEGIYRSFRRDICRAIGVPQDTSVNDIVLAATACLANGNKEIAHRLQTWMDACEAKINGGIGAVPDAELLQIARGLQALRKDLHLGGTDAARPD